MSNVALSGNRDIDGILWGVRWDAVSLTYGFATATSQYIDYQVGSISGFQAFNAAQRAAANAIVAQLNGFMGLAVNFTNNGANANLRFAEASFVDQDGSGSPGTISTAVGTPPDGTQFPVYGWGDMFFNRNDYNTPVKGNFAYATIIHELGHALGLKHGHVTQDHPDGFTLIPKLPSAHDSMEYSVMTYRSNVGGPTNFYRNEEFGFAQTWMMNDIAALQYLYGADFTFNAGNSVYTWSSTTGQMSINGVGQGAPGANRIFLTIWDGGGIDTYDLSNYTVNLTINLNPGSFTVTAQNQLAVLNTDSAVKARGNIFNALLFNNDSRSLIENALGGTGNDGIVGNVGANSLAGGSGNDTLGGQGGNDLLFGGNGNDTITGAGGNDMFRGGLGADQFTGGAGSDGFVYTSKAEGGDIITDFTNSASNNDVFRFLEIDFGSLGVNADGTGTLQAAFFQSRADNLAQDANDRFIFRTGDKTLWFDSDGTGVTVASLIADLQNTAVFAISDIFII